MLTVRVDRATSRSVYECGRYDVVRGVPTLMTLHSVPGVDGPLPVELNVGERFYVMNGDGATVDSCVVERRA